MITTLILIFHVAVAFLLIFIVLVQGGKGAELGAAFGAGSSQTLFGGRGAATFLSKMTTVVAVVFMITSLTLAFFAVQKKSVVRQTVTGEQQKTPFAPASPATEIPVAPATPAPPAPPAPPHRPQSEKAR